MRVEHDRTSFPSVSRTLGPSIPWTLHLIAKLINWLFGSKARRREQLLSEPFPDAWLQIVRRTVHFYERLSENEKRRLRECIQIFVAEKRFVGCAGLMVTDDIKVTIAAGACVLLLGLPRLDIFPKLREVIVYPDSLADSVEAIGPDGRPYQISQVRAGEAWLRGPVVLAWSSVRRSVASPVDGYNVVYHEFAHVIDMQNSSADGMPPPASKAQYDRWARVFFKEFDRFVHASHRGMLTLIDPYGATNPAEFFAVVTEHFFEQPRQPEINHPELFELLADYYQVNPIRWRKG